MASKVKTIKLSDGWALSDKVEELSK